MTAFDQPGLLDGADDQFRLARLQTFNWGTFSNVFDFPIPREGYLFVGPSGSGKSTLLDAHAALMTPPKWVDFNVAARETERHGRDRSVATYIRGAWAQQTGDGGEYVSQYLRPGTTWSAIAETYRNGQGRCVVLAQVLWMRGSSTAPGDARRLHLVLEREFDVRELEFFARHEFDVRRFKHDLPDAAVHPEFSAYQERFRRLLGIDNERALRLLHKTQSAKNLGDLNVFLRDFMLDAPQTFEVAERLVAEFGELNAAHQAVVSARQQLDTLKPARQEHGALEGAERERDLLQEVSAGVDAYRERRRRELLDERMAELSIELEGSRQEALRLDGEVDVERGKLAALQQQRAGLGGGILEQLQKDIEAAELEKPQRLRRRDLAAAACKAMGWEMPDGAAWFVQRVDAARQRVLKAAELSAAIEERKDGFKDEHRRAAAQFQSLLTEVRAMERQRSNIPARLLDLRQAMSAGLGIAEEKLPFVGELLEVRPEAAAWQGAIERVLGGFARSMLVDDRHYAAVSAYLNERDSGERLAYFRVLQQVAASRSPGPASLVRKLQVAPVAHADWLREEIKVHFDFECADDMSAFRGATRAVTRQGQIKHNVTRHEKNDRHPIDDRSRWVLGFDNADKLALCKQRAAELGARIAALEADLARASREDEAQRDQALHCQTLSNMTWAEVDVASLLTRIADLGRRIDAEKTARPDLARMDAAVVAQEAALRAAAGRRTAEEVTRGGLQRDIAELQRRRAESARLRPAADETPGQKAALDARYARTGREIAIDSLDAVTSQVERGINAELRAFDVRTADLRNAIVQRFAEFNRRWPAESGGLDASLDSADDYFGKLARLETDGLPRFEERFLGLLKEQSDQNLTLLATRLDQERSAIRARMEVVNESLRAAPFNHRTHLVIETQDKTLDEVRLFRAGLKHALSHSFSAEAAVAEQRFLVLAALVKRLASSESADRHWRDVVLDVRQHVEFVARELDDGGLEVEIYRSGAGKSGGQRQKLAATCLAAALRYQLGGQDRSLPSFSTVVLDEAFDKADAEFTATAMNIFKTFGFQMIVATPLKSVMTLEPFIGGACFVHITDRRKSAVIPIDYDSATQRLKLTPDVRHAEEAAVS